MEARIVETVPLQTTPVLAREPKAQGGPKAQGVSEPLPSALAPIPPVRAIDDDVVELPTWRKWVILFVVCWMALPTLIWSTAIMTATPEIAADYHTTPTNINTANAGVFVAMALSALIWLPISTITGRRTTYLVANVVLCACSIGAALAPNMACFTTLWIIGGTTGPFFLVAGQTILADIFEPVRSISLLFPFETISDVWGRRSGVPQWASS